MPENIKLAYDRASVRSIDQDGRLHVEVSNISKACVNPYRGSEIPSANTLGLQPDRVYYLLRDPAELAKGAPTFNNIPILNRHVPVHVTMPQKDAVVGSTGTDADFDGTYLRNSLVIWTAEEIAGINNKIQYELSSAYRYDADMTPGSFAGVAYDGIMRNIRGNHVALVEEGRAGPDVVVGDSKLLEKPKMSKKLSANARAVKGALIGFLSSRLAMDAQIGDLTAIAGSVKSLKTAKAKNDVIAKVTVAVKGLLAEDANLDALPDLLATLALDESDDTDDTPPKKVAAADADEDLDEDGNPKKKVATDGDPDDDKVDKKAMDSAIAAATAKARAETIAHMTAIQTAQKDVAPLLGEIAAMDSADAIYKMALDQAEVSTEGVHPSAFRAMVGMLVKSKPAATTPASTFALDAKAVSDFNKRYPKAGSVKGGV